MGDIDVCNEALEMVGQTVISSLNDATEIGYWCKRNYPIVVRQTLRQGRWKSARKRQDLSLTATSPLLANVNVNANTVGGWPPGTQMAVTDDGFDGDNSGLSDTLLAYGYQLPGDFIRLCMFNDQNPLDMEYPLFEIRKNVLWTNQTSANIDFVCDVLQNPEGITVLDPMLLKAISCALAAKAAWRWQQEKDLQDSLKREAQTVLAQARAIDARDEKVALGSPYIDSQWIRSRSSSTNF